MSSEQGVSLSAIGGASSVASPNAQHSSHRSPSSVPNSSGPEASAAMAAPTFVPSSQAFRSQAYSQSPYPLKGSGALVYEREVTQPVGIPFADPSMIRVLIRRLPLNTSEESLRLMVVWSKELSDVELLPAEQPEDPGFRSAILYFASMNGAMEVKGLLDGRSNISNDANMIVDILSDSPSLGQRSVPEPLSANPSSNTSSTASSAPGSRHPSRFNGHFQSMDRISPTSTGAFGTGELPDPDASVHYQNLFSPQSPIGNHLTERTRISGKTMINNNFDDDDETSDLLKDPVAYAENGASGPRRATAPQLPIGGMASLSLNTNGAPPMGPSSVPQYMSSMTAAAMSPMSGNGNGNGNGNGSSYSAGSAPPYQRPNFPPVNPADQNPPCNTLYVGNLPVDTSEEELKAMFSKQRGYKRLCFRTKQNGPMCFVEFEDISFATKALHELYGSPLHNSVKGGIRLSFSKNPLGVRSGQSAPMSHSHGSNGGNGMMQSSANGFTSAGPPPGLSAPPGLGPRGQNYNLASSMSNGPSNHPYHVAPFPNGIPSPAWNGPSYQRNTGSREGRMYGNPMGPRGGNNHGTASPHGSGAANYPPHMMGR